MGCMQKILNEFKSIGSHCIGLHVNALKFNILW